MAFLRIVRNHVDPSKFEAVLALTGPTVDKREATSDGLQCRYVARDPATGQGLISTVWDTREQAARGITRLSDSDLATLQALGWSREQAVVMEIMTEFVNPTAGAASVAFLRVVRTHLDPSKFEELRAVVGSTARERETATPGLQCRYVARDPVTGDGLISLVTDTREQAVAGINRLPDEVYAKLDALGWTHEPPVVMEISHQFVRAEATATV